MPIPFAHGIFLSEQLTLMRTQQSVRLACCLALSEDGGVIVSLESFCLTFFWILRMRGSGKIILLVVILGNKTAPVKSMTDVHAHSLLHMNLRVSHDM